MKQFFYKSFFTKFLNKKIFLFSFRGGFTLLEVLIVVGVVAIMSVTGSAIYTNYNKGVEIDALSETMSSDLKQAQSKSMIGEGGYKWGVRFVNSDTDYYEVFSTPSDYDDPSKVIASKNYLPNGIDFSYPAVDSSKDIIFDKISQF